MGRVFGGDAPLLRERQLRARHLQRLQLLSGHRHRDAVVAADDVTRTFERLPRGGWRLEGI